MSLTDLRFDYTHDAAASDGTNKSFKRLRTLVNTLLETDLGSLADDLAGLRTGTDGDLPYRGAGEWQMLGIGLADRVLTSDGTAPQWSQSLNLGGGLNAVGSIDTSANLIAGSTIYSGTSGIHFGSLLGGAPLTNIPALAPVCTNLDADLLDGQHGSYYRDAGNLNAGTVPLARLSGITNTEIAGAAAIAWTKISKTGSSLADLATRSAGALDTGTLSDSRLSANVALENTANVFSVGQTIVESSSGAETIGLFLDNRFGAAGTAVALRFRTGTSGSSPVAEIVGTLLSGPVGSLTFRTRASGGTLTNAMILTSAQELQALGAVVAHTIRRDSADGSDSSQLEMTGGGSFSSTRGALLGLYGNEHATNPGVWQAVSGQGGDVRFLTNPSGSSARRGGFPGAGGFYVGNTTGRISTSATDGFLHIPACAGTPTGVPNLITGTVPLCFDDTNHKLYVYSGGGWKTTTVFA
jgi:hypothetical protein